MANCSDCGLPVEAHSDQSRDGTRARCEACTTLAEGDCPIRLAPLGRDDLELALAWRSNPKVYEYFRLQNGPLDWDEHVTWFESRPPGRYDFVIHYDDRRVGVVSIDSDDDVGIYLGDFSARGHGVATGALDWLCERFAHRTPLFAEVNKGNDVSRQLFRRCGFRQENIEEEWVQYRYDSPSTSSH